MTRKREPAVTRLAIACAVLISAPVLAAPQAATGGFADTIYRNGSILTLDAHDSIAQALAVRDGAILYVGDDAGARQFIGPRTRIEDLHAGFMMPGLVDGHMHPLGGGRILVGCDLKYERLTAQQFQARVQHCLDVSRSHEPDGWLEAHNWFQEAMIGGTVLSKATLDALHTRRPILVVSSFGHTALANSRALQLAHLDAHTPDPVGGHIERDAAGGPTGLLQDAAAEPVRAVIPPPTPADDIRAAEAALAAMRAQGITTFLDAAASPQTLAAFAGAEKAGELTARAHFAVVIRPADAGDPQKAVAAVRALARRYDQGPIVPVPHLTVRNVKLFLDGIITAPALTGAMLEP